MRHVILFIIKQSDKKGEIYREKGNGAFYGVCGYNFFGSVLIEQ